MRTRGAPAACFCLNLALQLRQVCRSFSHVQLGGAVETMLEIYVRRCCGRQDEFAGGATREPARAALRLGAKDASLAL